MDEAVLETAIDAMRRAIAGGVEIPSEFEPFVRQHLPAELAKSARYADRQGLIGRMMGRPATPELKPDSAAPNRRVDELLLETPGGDIGTRIPNTYRGPLDDGEPRMSPPRTMWGA